MQWWIGHGHLFRSAFLFKKWYELLVGKVKDIENEEYLMERGEALRERTSGLEAEAKLM